MFSKKILFPVAFVSVAALVGCGDDSSSGANTTEIPEKVNSLQEVMQLPCNESLKCTKVLIEEHNDYMECDGASWQTVIEGMPSVCAATPASSDAAAPASSDAAAPASSDEAAPTSSDAAAPASSDEAAPASSDAAAPASSDEAAPASSDAAAPASSDAAAPASSDAAAPASSDEAAPASSDAAAPASSDAAAAPASGDMVSCDVPGVMGECLEFAAGTAEAQQLSETCVSVLQGTLGTGCPK